MMRMMTAAYALCAALLMTIGVFGSTTPAEAGYRGGYERRISWRFRGGIVRSGYYGGGYRRDTHGGGGVIRSGYYGGRGYYGGGYRTG